MWRKNIRELSQALYQLGYLDYDDPWLDNHRDKNILMDYIPPDLIYVYVKLAAPDKEKDRFFILKKEDAQTIFSNGYRRWMNPMNWQRPKNYKSLDNRCNIDDLLKYESNWQLIQEALENS